jgi:energy-coupling factor transporter ATP-binding protein EcfA2
VTEKPTTAIDRLIFSGGQTVSLEPGEKVILVGPNNSGKSQSLREIVEIAKAQEARTVVVKQVSFSKTGDVADLKQFLEQHGEFFEGSYHYADWRIAPNQLNFWGQPGLRGNLAKGFIKNIDANERLNICDQQPSVGPADRKSKPQQILYDSEASMDHVSSLFKRAFGLDIFFDFRGGAKIPIHVGKKPTDVGPNQVSDMYVAAVRENPLLDRQGDGMKSYAGILFETVPVNMDVTLIDEPEAFLHPPQMRRLGETLAAEVKKQLIVATHSSDVLRGFLEGSEGKIRILRISRQGDRNNVFEAPAEAIKELWERPELRYSNALEGIFHDQVVVCEDDSDCRLFNSAADYLASKSDVQWPDTAYVPTGGKHGIPKVASVLRRTGVPVKAIFDLDFLSDAVQVQATVEAFGADWDDFSPLWDQLDAAVRAGIRPKTTAQIKEELVELIRGVKDEENLPRGDINEVMKQSGLWHSVKKYGSLGIPAGQAQVTFEALRDKLEGIGIYMVPVGEIENFCRDVGSHGPKFVTKVLSEISLGDQRLDGLRKFTEKVHLGESCRHD